MPAIEIRPAAESDIPNLALFDHTIVTNTVWQMDMRHAREQGQIIVRFQKVQLPRTVNYDYPKPIDTLFYDWKRLSGLLLGTIANQPVAYVSLVIDRIAQAVWVIDLVVDKDFRRQGIGSAMLLASAEFAHENNSRMVIMEMQPKNGPAVALAQKMGFDFCGFNDHYFPGNETAIFFRKTV